MDDKVKGSRVISYNSNKNGIGGIILSVLISLIILTFLNYFSVINLSSILPFLPTKKPTVTQKPTLRATSFTNQVATCDITKEGNPIVDDVQFDSKYNMVYGTLRGNINNIVNNSGTVQIELVSVDGAQEYKFEVKEENGLVYDRVALKELTLVDLTEGNTVIVSYNCFKEKAINERFKIAQIAVIGRLK